MYSVESVESAVRELYFTGVANEEYSRGEVERLLYGIDFISLTQAVRHKAETVYAYIAQSERPKSLNYRGGELFEKRATRLYTDFDQRVTEAVTASRTVELWLLEDMTFSAVARVSVEVRGGAYCTENGEQKADPWESGMDLDLELLTDELIALCAEYAEGDQPCYEL